jgi:photosystem II stability/assembly factor-like uncharacterized protein
MWRKAFPILVLCMITALANTGQAGSQTAVSRAARPEKPVPDTNAMIWRFIGPIAGTRGSVVLGHPTERTVFYHGASAGLWKTPDAGLTWVPVGDGQFRTGSVGAMEISLSNPDVMYVGMGEPQMRNNVSWGDGVYKSVDGGETWTHLGLEETHHISQIRIHPTNPDLVYVAAYGHAFGPNPERGVYRTSDGGETWEQVLFKSERAGAIDLVMNPADPNELFASIWEFERKAWGPKTGGDEGGIWKSTDGGDTWTEITGNPGLPGGSRGRIGLTMSAADPDRVYALIDSETRSGLYRSDDSGATWAFVSDFFQIIGRPFYYSHIYANPANADELWSPNNRIWSSADGGKTWLVEPGIKDDFHDVWIDPTDANRMIASCDGGVQVSLTGGMSWSTQWTQKTTQIYRVHTDNDFPYNVYVGRYLRLRDHAHRQRRNGRRDPASHRSRHRLQHLKRQSAGRRRTVHTQQPGDRPERGAKHLPGTTVRKERLGPALPLPVGHAHRGLEIRARHHLLGRQRRLQDKGRGLDVGAHQPRPDERSEGQAGHRRNAVAVGVLRPGDLQHDPPHGGVTP